MDTKKPPTPFGGNRYKKYRGELGKGRRRRLEKEENHYSKEGILITVSLSKQTRS